MEKQWISTPFEKYFARTIEDMKLLTQVNLDSFHHKYQNFNSSNEILIN